MSAPNNLYDLEMYHHQPCTPYTESGECININKNSYFDDSKQNIEFYKCNPMESDELFLGSTNDLSLPHLKSIEEKNLEQQLEVKGFPAEISNEKELVTETVTSVEMSACNPFDEVIIENAVVEMKPKKETSERKKADDSIRKKIKTKTEEVIMDMINSQLARKYNSDPRLRFVKLPQNYIKTASIPFNSAALEMTIEARYLCDFDEPNPKKFETNKKVIEHLREKYPRELQDPHSILKWKVKDLYATFFQSSKFLKLMRKICEDEGEEYAKKFYKLAKGDSKTLGYVEYYLKTPGNKSRKNKNNE